MGKANKKAKLSTRKKIWIDIISPESFNKTLLGETLAYEPKDLVGKTISTNLSILLRDPKKQNINVSFRITSVQQQQAETSLYKLLMLPSSIKRMIRRAKSKIDDSFVAISADGKRLRIKPLLITKNKAARSVQTALRMGFRAQLIRILRKTPAEEFFKSIIHHKQQRESFDTLKKIYPLSVCEVRSLEIISENEPLPERVPEEQLAGQKDTQEEKEQKEQYAEEKFEKNPDAMKDAQEESFTDNSSETSKENDEQAEVL